MSINPTSQWREVPSFRDALYYKMGLLLDTVPSHSLPSRQQSRQMKGVGSLEG